MTKLTVAIATHFIDLGKIRMNIDHNTALRKATLFCNMDAEEMESLIGCLSPQVKSFAKNEIILMAGEPIRHLGIVLYGNACAYSEQSDGSRMMMSNLSASSVFGEILVSTRTHISPVTIYAESDVAVVFIEYKNIYSICAKACHAHSLFLQNMLKVIGDKYFYLFDRINILREKTLRARIMAYLHSLEVKDGTVTLPFSKTMLAGYLLANRSALSKELSKMERDGIITMDGRVIKIIKAV